MKIIEGVTIFCFIYWHMSTAFANGQCLDCLNKLGQPSRGEPGEPGPQGPPGRPGAPGSACGCSDPAFQNLRKELEFLQSELADLKQHMKIDFLTWKNVSNGLMYRFYEESVTYEQAKKNCEMENARIASTGIRRLSIRKELLSGIADTVTYLWVGLDDKNREGRWIWSDGVRDVRHHRSSLWRSGEPNNIGGVEDCALMYIVRHSTGEVSLSDATCGIGYYVYAPYICEREP